MHVKVFFRIKEADSGSIISNKLRYKKLEVTDVITAQF